MEIYRCKVIQEVECLVYANSERQALGIICNSKKRLFEESDDPILESIEQWDTSGFEQNYVPYGTHMSLAECQRKIGREAA